MDREIRPSVTRECARVAPDPPLRSGEYRLSGFGWMRRDGDDIMIVGTDDDWRGHPAHWYRLPADDPNREEAIAGVIEILITSHPAIFRRVIAYLELGDLDD
jgi:hypothetical protein